MTATVVQATKPSASYVAVSLRERPKGDLSLVSRCTNCRLRELSVTCNLAGLPGHRIERLVQSRKRVQRRQNLYHAGEPFHSFFAVRGGLFKSIVTREDGLEQITGFHMMGDVVGMDGIGSGNHASSVVALEDGEVCELPYQRLADFGADIPGLQSHVHRLLSREIVREQSMMLLLGSMRKEQRLAAFLLNLSQRLSARCYSPCELTLSMTREEIGCYLGMTLETVSRLFSRLRDEGLIDVRQKRIWILDPTGLERLIGPELRARLCVNG